MPTNFLPRLLLASALIPATAASALAQPAATAPATTVAAAEPAPPADDVSQVNGQLVPVGLHNDYKKDFPRFNVSTNPLGWVFGLYGASISYAPFEHLAFRADVGYMPNAVHSDDVQISAAELRLAAPIYFRRAYKGVYLEPALYTAQAWGSVTDENGTRTASATLAGPEVLVGYSWLWDSGLNISAAIGAGNAVGAAYNSTSEEEVNLDGPFLDGYLRFGYAF